MILAAAILIYWFAAFWMLFAMGWPIRAGLLMIIACVLPFSPLFVTDEPIGPGTGLLALATLPFIVLALLAVLVGTVKAVARKLRVSSRSSAGL